jgi:hypothetical protein
MKQKKTNKKIYFLGISSTYNPYLELMEISVNTGILSVGNHDNRQTSSG